jgi:glycosyltransferase involved in cell wall biosynthesis
VLATNPYQRLLYEHLQPHGFRAVAQPHFKLGWLWSARHECGVVHFHWPDCYYRYERGPLRIRGAASWAKLGLFAIRLTAARKLGYRVVWTIHQVLPHERAASRIDVHAARTLARASDLLVAHDAATASIAGAVLHRSPEDVHVIPHGSYVGVYPPRRSRADVRAQLGVRSTTTVFLAFGQIRGYKSLQLLLTAFSRARLDDAVLVVAGSVDDEGVAETIERAARTDSRVCPLLEHVRDDAVAELFGAADVAVIARADGGTSGSLILGLSLGKAVIAPDAPSYHELIGDEAGWLFERGETQSLVEALESAAADADAVRSKGAAALDRAERLDWPAIAASFARSLKALRPRRPRPAPVDALLVCSSGGHLLQLMALKPAWEGFERCWVTLDKTDARSLLDGETVFYAHGPTYRNVKNLARNLLLAWRIVRRTKPRVVLTTGAAVAVPFAWVARLRGARVVYVESITRIEEPSLTCRIIMPVADRVYAQWPELAARLRHVRYAGAVISSR